MPADAAALEAGDVERVEREVERPERRGAARVAHVARGTGHAARRRGDLGVGNAQEDRVAAGHLAATGRLADVHAGLAQRAGECMAHAAASDDADGGHIGWQRGRGFWGGWLSIQFSHARYRSLTQKTAFGGLVPRAGPLHFSRW